MLQQDKITEEETIWSSPTYGTMITIALRGMTVLPAMTLYLDMGSDLSISAANAAMKRDQKLFLVTQTREQVTNPREEDLETMGTIVRIKQIVRMTEKQMRVLVSGEKAGRLLRVREYVPFLVSDVEEVEPVRESPEAEEAMMRIIREQLGYYISRNPKVTSELKQLSEEQLDLISFTDRLAGNLRMNWRMRQSYLEQSGQVQTRYEFLVSWLNRETEIETFRADFQSKVKKNLDQHQKEYILREQMKVIREELGEGEVLDADEYQRQLDALKAPKEVKEQILKEIRRLRMFMGGQEMAVSQSYIETLLAMPWEERTQEVLSIPEARKILEADHYGLEKVKQQILEYLAVRLLKGQQTGQILCLVGPPGTGKTSIAHSIARALNRKYVRISLGGIHDEAEIRGHRRTYIASMPGKIAAGIKKAGVKNPLMLLDEIDKVSSDTIKGDTSAALLEVLDSEQNHAFQDHYLEVPLDLSEVLFLATANTTQTIPKPLLDRMEVIEINSYTENEKYHIAEHYLLPKQQRKSGLPEGALQVAPSAIETMIRYYTREAGVRSLERKLGELCRKVAWEYLEQEKTGLVITNENLEQYLGKKLVHYENANLEPAVGIVRGLAWTQAGGDTLQIEVCILPGKGSLVLTGQMGDVMKESAQIAYSFVRSVAEQYAVPAELFETKEFHLHIPEGAVPKDGPSAGITMATAILSAASNRKVRPELAMTGEVTLRGRVLAIGGLKEKLLAAKKAGIRQVLVPWKNQEDVAELSEEITGGLVITYVRSMNEVLKEAFVEASVQT